MDSRNFGGVEKEESRRTNKKIPGFAKKNLGLVPLVQFLPKKEKKKNPLTSSDIVQ